MADHYRGNENEGAVMITLPTPNILLATNTDKVGHFLISIKNALVTTGLWRVRGSGDGTSTFQLMGQTAGVGGSYDVFTGNGGLGYGTTASYPGPSETISRVSAWMVLEEISSGRCLTLQRGTTGQLHMCGRMSLGGVASSGASNTAVPAAVGTSALIYAGAAMNGGGSNFWGNTVGPWANPGNGIYLHLGVSESARSLGVCPFFAVTFDRTNNDHLGCLIYESMSSAPSDSLHPLAVVATRVGEAVGLNGFAGAYWVGGPSLLAVRPCGFVTPGGNVPPAYAPLDSDGYYRTKAMEFRYQASGAWVGISEHYFVQPVTTTRHYPTQYFSAEPVPAPRIAITGFLFPWATSTAAGDNAITTYSDMLFAIVSADVSPPTVLNISPAEGTQIEANQTISFRVYDETRLAFSAVFIKYPSLGRWDVVFDGVNTSPRYSVTRTAVVGGYDYTVACKGGWPATPYPIVRAVDGGGTLDEE